MDINFDSSDDGGSRNELFTPIRGGRKSLIQDFSPTPSRSITSEELATPAPKNKNAKKKLPAQKKTASFFDNDDTPNTLPKLHNSSWLGADMSPIRKGETNNNNNDEDAVFVAPYRLGLTETSESSAAPSESFFLGANDDTDELEGSKAQTPKNNVQHANSNNNGSAPTSQKPRMFYNRLPLPLFSFARSNTNPDNGQQQRPRRRKLLNPSQSNFWNFWSALTSPPGENDPSSSYVMVDAPSRFAGTSMRSGNRLVIGATVFVLFCIGIHDAFLAYLAMRRGDTSSGGFAWALPWVGPTGRSLLRFGAFCPERLLKASSSEYWRSLTSMVISISLVEWILLVWVWTRYLPSKLLSPASNFSWQLSWPVVYVLSSWTGQLWMMAFHYETIRTSVGQQQDSDLYDDVSLPALSGCAGWATAGVLTAVGIQAPSRRFPCFLSSSVLVLLHQCQNTGSVIGCSGAAFFGWAYSGLWSHNFPEADAKRWQREMLHRDYTYYYDVLQEQRTFVSETHQWTLWHVLAAMIVFLLWFSPIIFLLYR